MAACVVNDLIAANPCLAALSPFDLQVVKTQMLCNLLDKLQNGGEVTCDIATLLDQGKCFYDLDPFMLEVVEASLLCEISQAV